MAWFLVILFMAADGGVEVREGWYPLQMPNEYVCGESVKRVIAYLNSIDTTAVAYCQLLDTGPEPVSSRGENV